MSTSDWPSTEIEWHNVQWKKRKKIADEGEPSLAMENTKVREMTQQWYFSVEFCASTRRGAVGNNWSYDREATVCPLLKTWSYDREATVCSLLAVWFFLVYFINGVYWWFSLRRREVWTKIQRLKTKKKLMEFISLLQFIFPLCHWWDGTGQW